MSYTILLVEDDELAGEALRILLEHDFGWRVIRAPDLAAAIEVATREEIDAAVLDVSLGDEETSFPVAEILESRGVPYAFCTGYPPEYVLEPPYSDRPVLIKPPGPELLRDTLEALIRERQG